MYAKSKEVGRCMLSSRRWVHAKSKEVDYTQSKKS